ncbi:RidA family protein [Phytoactinopolyspora alkaliphila]|uniref:RidA family protein n=1 Tax=Phytoactinopolyspora alkaliphila TaxID=1783498 RepID=A0A6N9YJF7_9ACTN|nr:RidA family protein [Phytoactinopolyspora alkaliphila]NED95009.1 RidA family protein [Phytoactinopolyspora alkaliphila]
MTTAEQRLAAILPEPPPPLPPTALIDAVAIDEATAYVSGQVAFTGSGGPLLGRVGAGVSVDEAATEAAKATANGLYRLAAALGSLDRIERMLKATVFVNGTAELTEHPQVADGVSRTLLDVLGERGRHARSAVGVASLPLGVPVEVELVARVLR